VGKGGVEKYPVGSAIKGTVVNVMSYGAFVKLEDGIEGLVHISEMSWTKRISHPSELVQHRRRHRRGRAARSTSEKHEISPRHEADPSRTRGKRFRIKYPVGSMVKGKVRNLTNYGAFIEIEEGIDGSAARERHVVDPQDQPPERIGREGPESWSCKRAQSVDQERRRIALGLKQLDEDPWATDIPNRYQQGQLVKGKVTKITNFGVFVGLEDGLEGLLHISRTLRPEDREPRRTWSRLATTSK
jgi:small subunit ribosomal protein S1